MAYLGLDIDSLCWEIKSLIKNNYGGVNVDNVETNFYHSKIDILERFGEIMDQNKEDIINEIKEEIKE